VNLRLFLRVLGRFKYLVAIGLVLAFALAALSYVRVSVDGSGPQLEYRSAERWQSTATLFVTQRGFPWGRSVLDEVIPVGPAGDAGYIPRYSDVGRFQTLAQLYAELAMGDDVRALVLQGGRLNGWYEAAPVSSKDGSTFLPLLAIAGFGATPGDALAVARRATGAFLLYLRRTQERNDIPAEKRVDIQVVAEPGQPALVEGRRITRPIFLFVLVLSAVVGLAFALENLRPRLPQEQADVPARPRSVAPPERKSA
jgi:hypothetical protein